MFPPFSRFAHSVRSRLILLTLAVLLPSLLLIPWMLRQIYQDDRRDLEQQLLFDAEKVSRLVDSLLENREAVLRTLAASGTLAEGDLEAFHALSQRVSPQKNEWIVLVDPLGQQLTNSRLPFGAPLPRLAGRYRATTDAGKTYLSGLTQGPATGGHLVFVALPVTLRGEPGYTLHYAISPAVISEILLQSERRPGWTVAVVDKENRVAARNRNWEQFVGHEATVGIRDARIGQPEGTLDDVSLEGYASIVSYSTSPHSGWLVLVAAPREELFATAGSIGLTVGVWVLGTLLTAVLLAAWLGGGVVRAVQALMEATRALGKGAEPAAVSTGLQETDHVALALQNAARELCAREAELARSRDAAVEASRAKDEFLATLSHELRTPLNPVLMVASDAATDPSHSAEARAAFAMIAKNVALEAQLIDDMLDLTRIVRGKLTMDFRVIDLLRVLRDAIGTVELEFSEKRLNLVLQLPSDALWIRGDATRLQQVFWNLLKNAAKFTPGGGTVTVSVDHSTCERVEVVVADTGIGMTDQELRRSFQSFSQGEHRLGGLGLGLAISRAIIEQHAGAVTVSSRGRGLGSTFTLALPRAVAPAPAATPAHRTRTTLSATPDRQRVLLVEDHVSSRQVLTRLLERRGYEAVAAGTVAEALEAVEREEFAVVISDIGLPDGDGYDLMSQIRQRRDWPGIALTGYGMQGDVAKAHQAGFVAHLTKPVTLEKLEEALQRATTQPTLPHSGSSIA